MEFSASGAVTVAPDGLVPATPSPIPYTLTHDGSGPGAWRLDYDGVATDVPGRTFLTTSIIGGRFALTFAGGGSGAIDPGGLFRTSVVIDGDWADPANRTGATFNAGYTLTSDFIVSGSTLVSVETLNWDGVNPGLSFTLFGGMAPSPVPVPGALGLLLAGLAGLAATRRRG